jgi:hypothetical protein
MVEFPIHSIRVGVSKARAQPVQARSVGQLPVHQPGVERLALPGLHLTQRAALVHVVLFGAQAFAQGLVVFDQQQVQETGAVSRGAVRRRAARVTFDRPRPCWSVRKGTTLPPWRASDAGRVLRSDGQP